MGYLNSIPDDKADVLTFEKKIVKMCILMNVIWLFQSLSEENFYMKFMTSGFYSSLELMEFLQMLNSFLLIIPVSM